MPVFLNTTGRRTLGIGICDRCARKFPLDDLMEDPETGLMVCAADRDERDPYNLPPRPDDREDLPFTQPDVSIEVKGGVPPVEPRDP